MSKDHSMGIKTYLNIFYLLLALTVLTIAQPYVMNLTTSFQVSVQLLIAFLKAFLIVAYYMHVKFEGKLLKAFIYFSIAIMITIAVLVMIDVYYRDVAGLGDMLRN